jgi:hypothetical protein
MNLDELIRESWRIYAEFESQSFVVKPSIPILFFGDVNKYLSSKLKVITLGLNPSRVEFPDPDTFLRFASARSVHPAMLQGALHKEYIDALNGYFCEPPNHPYRRWFNSVEPLLRGVDCSYYGNDQSTALHTDFCSPLATDPTWSNLPKDVQSTLFGCGNRLWHSLVEWLSPDLIVASIARRHLTRLVIPRQNGWRVVYTVNRANPFTVELARFTLGNGRTVNLVFGKAANTPFGTVSNPDKERIGKAVKDYLSCNLV